MSTTQADNNATTDTRVGNVDMKLETVVIPVSDVDRAKDFYVRLGWRLDADFGDDAFRIVQLTPPGSACSIQFGIGLTSAAPGSAEALLVVSDIEAAHDALAAAASTPTSSTTPASATTVSTPPRGRVDPIRNGTRTRRSRSSAIRTATCGSCRRSRIACPVASTPAPRRSPPSPISPLRSQRGAGARRARAAHR